MSGNSNYKPMEMNASGPSMSPKAGVSGLLESILPKNEALRNGLLLLFSFCGLQFSYITWGIVQERIMTVKYEFGEFKSSAFIVFSNRLLALFIAFIVIHFSGRTRTPKEKRPPFHFFAPSSISNVLSSWCQYEALKYVSFPMQVLSKSCKIIPVMFMGYLLQRKQYPRVEYIEAMVITGAVTLFTLSQNEEKAAEDEQTTSLLGVFLLGGYLLSDSFTSQWQDTVFKKYTVDQFEMMFGINTFSVLFTAASLLWSGELWMSLQNMQEDPLVFYHILIMSICSATGQMFIFYTIKKFGPIIFTIMMTIRQMLSMVVSCVMFGHSLSLFSWVGAFIVFIVLFLRAKRKMKSSSSSSSSSSSLSSSSSSSSKDGSASGLREDKERLLRDEEMGIGEFSRKERLNV